MELVTQYNPAIVVLSYVASAIGSFTTLQLIEQVSVSTAKMRKQWLLAASLCLGVSAIWCCHFIGMAAFTLHAPADGSVVPLAYDPLLVVVSLVAPCASVYFGLTRAFSSDSAVRALDRNAAASRRPGARAHSLADELVALAAAARDIDVAMCGKAALFVASGIVVMHFGGMASMRFPEHDVRVAYDARLVALSTVIAIGASFAALVIFLAAQNMKQEFLAAPIMAAAVCGVHYTGQASASFYLQRDASAGGGAAAAAAMAAISGEHLGLITALLDAAICFAFLAVLAARLRSVRVHLITLVEERTRSLGVERDRSDFLLYQLLPPAIADALKAGALVKPRTHANVSLVFADIVDFSGYSRRSSPAQVIALLTRMHHAFDRVVNHCGGYKVDTIGDAYIAATGVPADDSAHALRAAAIALRFVEAMSALDMRDQTLSALEVRVGIASGAVASGVVGTTLPRFTLFGETVNIASRMESSGAPSRVHIAESTARLVNAHFRVDERGTMDIKGHGRHLTFWLLAPRDDAPPFELPRVAFDSDIGDVSYADLVDGGADDEQPAWRQLVTRRRSSSGW